MKKATLYIFLLIIAGLFLGAATFVVDETQQVFVTQFGRPVGKAVATPGLHFKVPFLQKLHYFDKRFLEWDGQPNQVPTRDKRYISIDTYARWRIQDPLLFFQKVTDELGAQTRLDDILDGATRNAVANHDLVEIVRSNKREEIKSGPQLEGEETGGLPDFQFGRAAIAQNVLTNAAIQLQNWGIELLDIRFKRISYEEDVKRKIFERMISERQRIADKYRAEGQGEAAKILGQREKDLKSIESDAFRKVQEIKGEADAQAANIYSQAYNQSQESRDFYSFVKTMEAYVTSLSSNDWLILSTKTDFYQDPRLRASSRQTGGCRSAGHGAAVRFMRGAPSLLNRLPSS